MSTSVAAEFTRYAELDPRIEGLRQYALMLGERFYSVEEIEEGDRPAREMPHTEVGWSWLKKQVVSLVGYARIPPGFMTFRPSGDLLDQGRLAAWLKLDSSDLYTSKAYDIVYDAVLEAFETPIRRRLKERTQSQTGASQ